MSPQAPDRALAVFARHQHHAGEGGEDAGDAVGVEKSALVFCGHEVRGLREQAAQEREEDDQSDHAGERVRASCGMRQRLGLAAALLGDPRSCSSAGSGCGVLPRSRHDSGGSPLTRTASWLKGPRETRSGSRCSATAPPTTKRRMPFYARGHGAASARGGWQIGVERPTAQSVCCGVVGGSVGVGQRPSRCRMVQMCLKPARRRIGEEVSWAAWTASAGVPRWTAYCQRAAMSAR